MQNSISFLNVRFESFQFFRSHPTFRFDWFMRGRTVAEIKQRIQQLLLLIVREYLAEKEKIEENQTIPSSTGAINKRKLK